MIRDPFAALGFVIAMLYVLLALGIGSTLTLCVMVA